jgi:hypothetical protein
MMRESRDLLLVEEMKSVRHLSIRRTLVTDQTLTSRQAVAIGWRPGHTDRLARMSRSGMELFRLKVVIPQIEVDGIIR